MLVWLILCPYFFHMLAMSGQFILECRWVKLSLQLGVQQLKWELRPIADMLNQSGIDSRPMHVFKRVCLLQWELHKVPWRLAAKLRSKPVHLPFSSVFCSNFIYLLNMPAELLYQPRWIELPAQFRLL